MLNYFRDQWSILFGFRRVNTYITIHFTGDYSPVNVELSRGSIRRVDRFIKNLALVGCSRYTNNICIFHPPHTIEAIEFTME